jgi:LytS/YehU family sensor histidine kinase
VRGYLRLEEARFGRRLRVRLEVAPDAGPLDAVEVRPMQVLAAVRAVVQDEIEPRPGGGELAVTVRSGDGACRVDVQGPGGPPTVIVLPSGAALPG